MGVLFFFAEFMHLAEFIAMESLQRGYARVRDVRNLLPKSLPFKTLGVALAVTLTLVIAMVSLGATSASKEPSSGTFH